LSLAARLSCPTQPAAWLGFSDRQGSAVCEVRAASAAVAVVVVAVAVKRLSYRSRLVAR